MLGPEKLSSQSTAQVADNSPLRTSTLRGLTSNQILQPAELVATNPSGDLQETFFGGWSPRDLREEDDGVEELRYKMGLALGQATAPEDGFDDEPQPPRVRDPPWLVCCLQSYVPDDSSLGGVRCFRIFDTKLAA